MRVRLLIKTILFTLLITVVGVQGKVFAENPVPDIKANNSDGPVTINTTDTLSVTISLDAGGNTTDADWWVLAETPWGWYSYDMSNQLWEAVTSPALQKGLVDLDSLQILNANSLSEGNYSLYFGVDTNMNGSLETSSGTLFYDNVDVTVNSIGSSDYCLGKNTGADYNVFSSVSDRLYAMKFTTTSNVTVNACEVFTGGSRTMPNVSGINTIGIWSHDTTNDTPGTDLGTESWSMISKASWQGAELSDLLDLTADTTYWIVWAPVSGAQSSLQDAGSGDSVEYRMSTDNGSTWGSRSYTGVMKYRCTCQ